MLGISKIIIERLKKDYINKPFFRKSTVKMEWGIVEAKNSKKVLI
ncbi:hypothetical protein HMPREF3180_00940 [Leptotrichia wadei]|uniref:Uncharacterized protein n=1 Tax=Leptotrichia wadei TaxID=157687 RepID=A0A134AHQ1_9FUSO|nr:hypothetical protein HMPREF3180_00940 [Leptotrichia wadei]